MIERRITKEGFDTDLRGRLRFGHGFEHADLERAKGIIGDAIKHIEDKTGTRYGMGAQHLDTAMKYLHKEHEGWRGLSDAKKAHIETALKEHFGIAEEKEAA